MPRNRTTASAILIFFIIAATTKLAIAQKGEISEISTIVWFLLMDEGDEKYSLNIPLGLGKPSASARLQHERNPLTSKKIELGTLLFFDVRLSVDNSTSCASCHKPEKAFSDSTAVSTGVFGRQGTRNAPPLINRFFSTRQLFDVRADSLEEQAILPIINSNELGMPNIESVIDKLNAIEGYRKLFLEAFDDEITASNIGKAIASFERSLFSGNSRFDQFINGDVGALNDSEKRGFVLAQPHTGAQCLFCHAIGEDNFGNFTDEMPTNTGVGTDQSEPDVGEMGITGKPEDFAEFKTPTLRELVQTAPYMHDGSMETLEEVLEFYGNNGIDNPNLNHLLVGGLGISSEQDKADIVNFLKSLSGEGWKIESPNTFPE